MKKLIVKVQTSFLSSDGRQSVMVYDKSQNHMHMGPCHKELKKKMGSEHKKFFWATISHGSFNLLEEAPWQDW